MLRFLLKMLHILSSCGHSRVYLYSRCSGLQSQVLIKPPRVREGRLQNQCPLNLTAEGVSVFPSCDSTYISMAEISLPDVERLRLEDDDWRGMEMSWNGPLHLLWTIVEMGLIFLSLSVYFFPYLYERDKNSRQAE